MRTTARLGTIAVAVGTAAALAAGPASAAPSHEETFTLQCDSGVGALTVAVPPGNGEWTPGILTGSTRGVLIPVAFGDFTYQVRDAEGELLYEETEPGSSKRNVARGSKTPVTCTLTETAPASVDPTILEDFPTAATVSFSTTVTGYLNPSRR